MSSELDRNLEGLRGPPENNEPSGTPPSESDETRGTPNAGQEPRFTLSEFYSMMSRLASSDGGDVAEPGSGESQGRRSPGSALSGGWMNETDSRLDLLEDVMADLVGRRGRDSDLTERWRRLSQEKYDTSWTGKLGDRDALISLCRGCTHRDEVLTPGDEDVHIFCRQPAIPDVTIAPQRKHASDKAQQRSVPVVVKCRAFGAEKGVGDPKPELHYRATSEQRQRHPA